MDEKIIIRKQKYDDAEHCAKLNALVWKEAYKHIFPKQVFDNQQENISKRIQMFQSGINDENIITYVAEIEGEIVGYFSGSLISQYSYFADKGYADLLAIYIKPNCQGKGIATQFKKIFVEWLNKHGKEMFVVGVLKKNKQARQVYEKWGGVLSDYEQCFKMLENEYSEVFYTYKV